MLSTLPNKFTDNDLSVLKSTLQTGACKNIYDNYGYQITVTSFDDESNVISAYSEHIDIFAPITSPIRRVEHEINLDWITAEHLLPTEKTSFAEFKSTCEIVTWVDDGAINLEHPLIKSFTERKLCLPSAPCVKVIHNPKVKPFALFVEEAGGSTYFCYFSESQIIVCDSLDVALKFAFEDSDFKSESVLSFEKYLKSDEAKKSIDGFIAEFTESKTKSREFFESEEFKQHYHDVLEHLKATGGVVCESNCVDIGFASPSQFYTFVDAAFDNLHSVEDAESDFLSFVCTYEELNFVVTHGQGSVFHISMAVNK